MQGMRKILLMGLLVGEIAIFAMFFWFGDYGVKQLQKAKDENTVLQKDIDELRLSVQKLQKELESWQGDDFNKEKIAREKLQMAKAKDKVYLV